MTLWVLGLCISVLFLGGLGLDLWRVIELRRSLSATADATATAGANGLDETALRRGETKLNPRLAERLAEEQLSIEGDAHRVDQALINVGDTSVDVELVGEVDFSLLGIFLAGDPIEVHVRATAEPRRLP
jgi:hypothetical protein